MMVPFATIMDTVLSPLHNAVTVREMRSLMRGNKAPGALLVCTGLAVAGGLAFLQWQLDFNAPLSPERYAAIGRNLFIGIVLLEAVLAVLLVPILTAGMLAREYDQCAIDDLTLTRLTGMEIAWGKLAAGAGFAAVAMICLLPVLAVAFVLGGLSPAELIGSQVLVLALAVYFGAAAISYAAHYRNPAAVLLATWCITSLTMVFLLPFQFAIFFTVVLSTLGLDRIKRSEKPGWQSYLPEMLYGLFVTVPAMMLVPVLVALCFIGLNPPAALALLLLHDEIGVPNLFGMLNVVWWLLPLFSAVMLGYGAHTMLEDAAAMIRKTEAAE
ncbi:MAG: hypothetical protein ACYDCO_04595 [Armatimonadota bacterium]